MDKMDLYDFSPGQKAYIVYEHKGYNKAASIIETTVVKVGQKYVTVALYGKRFKHNAGTTNALIEQAAFGERGYLFPTREAAELEVKRGNLLHNIRTYSSYLDKCSYEELRKIMLILKSAGER